MLEDKKVSIILCFYNEEKYLAKAIDSVLAQTYSNFELIIINDGSSDSSDEIVKSYQDDRIRYTVNKENKRLAYCRNRGLEFATGDYIGFFDGDDIMMPEKMEWQVRYLKEHEDIMLVSGGYAYMDGNGNVDKNAVMPKYRSSDQIKAFMLFGNCIACAGAALFRREIIDRYHIRFDETNKASEDYRFWIDMLPYGKVANVEEVFFHYRINHGSKSSVIVKKDESAYDRELRKVLEYAWTMRGFVLQEKELMFIYDFLHKNIRVWKPGDIINGIRTYKKIKAQLTKLKLSEEKYILEYYKRQWMRTYKIYWLINKFIKLER